MGIGLHQLLYDEQTGAVVGKWTVHRRDTLTMKSRHVDFVDGVAKGVHGREMRRIVCAMGPSLSHAIREDGAGCIGDAADDGTVTATTVAPHDGFGGPVVPDYVPPEPEPEKPELAEREPTVPTTVPAPDVRVAKPSTRRRGSTRGRKPPKKK